MLPKALDELARDIESGREVSTRLKKALKPGQKGVTRAHQLELSTRVLDHACKSRSDAVENAFRVALESLRTLVPFLKKKTTSNTDTIALVEKYAVNFALSSSPQSLQHSKSSYREAELVTSLQQIFCSRAEAQKEPIVNKRVTRRKNAKQKHDKENEDPGQDLMHTVSLSNELIDRLFFPQAATLGLPMLLPNRDSINVATTTAGALAIRLTRCCKDLCLNDIVTLTEKALLPWLNYLRSFDDERSQGTSAAYLKRVACFLLDQCRMPRNDPATVLRTRLFALKLEDPKLNQFARDVLQSVNYFARSNKKGKQTQHVQDTIASVYESALRYLAKFDSSDPRWISEDVSAFLDNVALIWAKQRPEKSIPNVFLKRISTFRNQPSTKDLLECFKLQTGLFSVGAYELDTEKVSQRDRKLLDPDFWKNMHLLLKSISLEDLLDSDERMLFLADSGEFTDNWRVAEADGLRCLRLMRTLEPVRRFIAATSPKFGLPQGAELILRIYLSALFRGFCVLSSPGMNSQASAIGDILVRLNKMVGGAIEAARDLICSYAHQRLFGSLEDVSSVTAEILKHHHNYSPAASLSWTEWLYNVMASITKNTFIELKENKAEGEVLVLQLSEAILLCLDQMSNFTGNTVSFSQGYSTVMIALRDGLLSHGLWPEATDVSLQLFEFVALCGIGVRTHKIVSETARMVAQDVVRLARNGNPLSFFGDLNIPADKLLSAFVEYWWWARKNRASFKTSSKYLETIDGLVHMRKALFQYCDMSGMLCPVRRTHELWLAFVHSRSCQENRTGMKIWKSVKTKTCSGHYALGLTDPSTDVVSCTNFHSQFLEHLRKACEATVLKSFDRLTGLLSALESMLATNKKLETHLELITVSVEVLQWISTILAFNSFGTSANRALSLAHDCSSVFDVSKSLSGTRKVCRLLDSLPTFCPDETDEKGVGLKSRADNFRDTLNAPRALDEATSDLKSTLKTLLKFRTCSNEDDPKSYSVAGFSVDVVFDMSSMCGQHRLGLILELVHCLFRLGIAQVNIENLSEARYYMELCFQISVTCFPVWNNSFRRIASISRAKCMTRKDSRSAVQGSVIKQVPIEEEDTENGRDVFSSFSTLQTAADAMLYVEVAWNLESKTSSDIDGAHVDFIKATYERCRRILEVERQMQIPSSDLDTGRARLELNLGLTYLLKGDEATAIQLIKPLCDKESIHERDVTAAASYEVARLYIRQAGGLRAWLARSSDQLNSHNDLSSGYVRRRRTRRTKIGKLQTSIDQTRAALKLAVHNVVPCLGKFPLYRKVWNLAAMIESEPERMAWRLEKTVGLSFTARYGHKMRRKLVKRAEDVHNENDFNDICDLDEHLKQLSLDDTEEDGAQTDATEVIAMMAERRSVLAGVHMDEDKSSIVVWRRCALGFHLRRQWLPSSGPQSYDGISQRIESILSEMKQSSIREGQEMTKDEKVSWWEHRYRLDNQMRLVVTEIQEIWLGTAISLLIPSLTVGSEGGNQTAKLNFEKYSELGERACDTSDHGVALGDLILLVDKPSERIPWESLPLLRENEISATRTPSMSFLSSMWNPDKHFDKRSLFYVLNPDGNLRRTEDRFRDKLQCHAGWSGITGQTSSEVVASSYGGEEIYLYCGHGAGEVLFSPSRLCIDKMAPIALLMGCSSCRPRDLEIGDFESNGPAIEFLVHGSAAVVGNLWDVSDGEIDRLTSSVLSLWLGESDQDVEAETVSLADAVAQSRAKCRLPYLVGAACIVMGVPHIYVQQQTEN